MEIRATDSGSHREGWILHRALALIDLAWLPMECEESVYTDTDAIYGTINEQRSTHHLLGLCYRSLLCLHFMNTT